MSVRSAPVVSSYTSFNPVQLKISKRASSFENHGKFGNISNAYTALFPLGIGGSLERPVRPDAAAADADVRSDIDASDSDVPTTGTARPAFIIDDQYRIRAGTSPLAPAHPRGSGPPPPSSRHTPTV